MDITIPFVSLGNKDGILKGFQPDFIKITIGEKELEKRAIIGVYQDVLCSNAEYHAIVGL